MSKINPKKRILVVSQHFWPESFRINDICDYFINEKNCEIDVLCGIPNYPKGQFFKGYSYLKKRKEMHNKVNIHRAFEIPRGNNTDIKIFINYISFPISSVFHIPRLLTKKYDKIFLYQLSPVIMSFAGIVIGKLRKIETTIYILDLWPENLFSVINVKNKFFRKLVTYISHWHYRNVDKIIVLSERMKKRIVEIVNIDDSKIIVIPQTCEKLFEINIQDKTLEKKFKNGFNIVFTGNISPAQDFRTIIEVAKKLKSNGFIGIKWIIVGDGMSKKWLQNQIQINDLNDCFYLEGQKPIEDIPKYTNIADLLVGCLIKSNLLEATIPAKIITYLASGKPLVLAMDGEVQALINNTIKCGLVGPASDSDTLYKNIMALYHKKKDERINVGVRGKEYYLKNFERNIILNKLYNFIFDSDKI